MQKAEEKDASSTGYEPENDLQRSTVLNENMQDEKIDSTEDEEKYPPPKKRVATMAAIFLVFFLVALVPFHHTQSSLFT